MAAVAALTAALLVALGLFGSAIGRGEVVTVDAQQALTDPQSVIDELADTGISARIVVVPTKGERSIGRWNTVTFDQAGAVSDGELADLRQDIEGFNDPGVDESELSLPKGTLGLVTLFVNGEAAPGQRPWFFDNSDIGTYSLSPVGPFWCLALEQDDPATATAKLEQLGYEVKWMWDTQDGESGSVLAIDHIPAGSAVVGSVLQSATKVDLRLSAAEDADRIGGGIYATPSAQFPRETWSSWAPSC
jgi:hypothetical protein